MPMHYLTYTALLVAALSAGCQYEAPLETAHTIPIDQSVLGLWEPVPDEGEESDPDGRMLILPFSETEYSIHYPTVPDGLYYRAYPVTVDGISCVQLEVIGNRKGVLDPDEKERYHVITYGFKGKQLEIKTLNEDWVNDELKTTSSIRKAFQKNKNKKDLFSDPGLFRKQRDES